MSRCLFFFFSAVNTLNPVPWFHENNYRIRLEVLSYTTISAQCEKKYSIQPSLKRIRLLTSKFKGPLPVGGHEYQRINNSLVVCHIPQHFGELRIQETRRIIEKIPVTSRICFYSLEKRRIVSFALKMVINKFKQQPKNYPHAFRTVSYRCHANL